MKLKFIIFLIGSLIFQSCQTSIEKEHTNVSEQNLNNDERKGSEEIKAIKSVRIFKYKINNSNDNDFGFLSVLEDQSIGVRNIYLYKDFVFLSDPVHGNVKKINLSSGKICAVSPLLDKDNDLRNITVFNDFVYVLTDNEINFILDTGLNKIGNLLLPQYKGVKDVFKQTENELILYRPIEDVIQQNDKRMKISILKVDKTNSFQKDSLIWSYDEYNKSAYGSSSSSNRGKQYTVFNNKEGKRYFINEHGKFELREILPTTFKYYDSKNIDFTPNKIAYYNVTSSDVILTVNSY